MKDVYDHMLSYDVLPVVSGWKSWLREERGYSVNTFKAYETDLNGFLFFVYEGVGRQITLEDIKNLRVTEFRKWLADRHKKRRKPNSNARALSVLRSFFRYLYRVCGIDNQSIFYVSKPIVRKGLPKVLEELEIRKLMGYDCNLHWTYKRDLAVAALLYGCGLRISEAVGMRFCDLTESELRVLGKGKKERVVPVLPWVKVYLETYIESCPHHVKDGRNTRKYVFLGLRGEKLGRTYFANRMQVLRRKLGLSENTTPHALRHSFATHIFLRGADIRVVQELLGHASLSTTQIYTHLDYNSVVEHYKGFHPQTIKKDDKL